MSLNQFAPRQRRTITLTLQLAAAGLLGLGASLAMGRFERRSRRPGTEAGTRHGGAAMVPTEIPLRGWRDILIRTYAEVGKDRVLAVAAGVTFYGLLALFPAVTAFVSLYGLVADPGTVAEQLSVAGGILPGGALDVVRDQVGRITSESEARLGFALLVSVGLSAWSANAGMKAIFDALNVAYGEEEKRGFVRLNLTSLGFTVALILFAILALVGIAAIPVLLDNLYLGAGVEWLLWLGRWPVLLVVVTLGLSMLYRYGPSRENARWQWVSPGAVFASVAWLAGSLLFSWYVANFEDYNKTYGTLGAVIGLLMWMWLSATIILLGAELNSEAERQTLRDTTEGAPAPIGLRGANAADDKR
jgi:membrane protein